MIPTASAPPSIAQTRRPRTRSAPLGLALLLAAGLGACTNPYDPGQRALGGAALGAGTGAAIGALAGGGRGAATGALIGGAIGAVGGAATTPPPPSPYEAGYPPAAPASWSPEMVWLPSPGVYVALGYNYPLFFYSGLYYYLYSGRWYVGSSYSGPWRIHAAPPPLRRFHSGYWNSYQMRARNYYHNNPGWRHFRPR
ncbi:MULTISPECIES: hypothetical protein [Acidiphilium]|uniref:17 kDa surface antigen n=3 Tax=Acidiphilium TaxID=522 RepID=A5FVW6_ACICJ|nr:MULTISPECIES: hypothetical protein [Acidiphilium]MBU6355555.1 hypothetical protein [Rhodospirillales bacterium]ABQ29748.1 hypothetical protein Acry_0524 [Acidiphilium cryptum JF-5]KDM67574.1 hypothetical protein ACIDI_31c00380 [Acidiphilium sp. JA12-A1]MBS3023861.1 hypothetical protein [Acidiphilium multivorum]MDE2327131.1 hypothetical protein [Rhodospirillales bacterium]